MQIVASILWRKLDGPGHDACRLQRSRDGWQLDGAAVFAHSQGRIAQLHYRVRCDRQWHTQWGTVRGWLAGETVNVSINRTAEGEWTLNDVPVSDLGHCLDLDLGFTPATNLLALRRMHLAVGDAAEAPAAWLDLDRVDLGELKQRYTRTADSLYAYAAPHFDYAQTLEVTAEGFVSHYPGLWRSEP